MKKSAPKPARQPFRPTPFHERKIYKKLFPGTAAWNALDAAYEAQDRQYTLLARRGKFSRISVLKALRFFPNQIREVRTAAGMIREESRAGEMRQAVAAVGNKHLTHALLAEETTMGGRISKPKIRPHVQSLFVRFSKNKVPPDRRRSAKRFLRFLSRRALRKEKERIVNKESGPLVTKLFRKMFKGQFTAGEPRPERPKKRRRR